MQGLATDGTPHPDPDNNPTKFKFSGDPATGTGWLDTRPGDRWYLMSSGPFDFAAGDTQTIAAAKIVGHRHSNVGSVAELKVLCRLVQNFYDASIQNGLFDGKVKHVSGFALYQNYPNPFNPKTMICFDMAAAGFARLDIYNMLGQHVKTLVDTKIDEGNYNMTWNASDKHGIDVPSGIYFCRLNAKNYTRTNKMIVLR